MFQDEYGGDADDKTISQDRSQHKGERGNHFAREEGHYVGKKQGEAKNKPCFEGKGVRFREHCEACRYLKTENIEEHGSDDRRRNTPNNAHHRREKGQG